jgi:HlyD family secretion protein
MTRLAGGQVLAQINTDIIDDQITQRRAPTECGIGPVAQAQASSMLIRPSFKWLREVYRISGGKVSRTELRRRN